MSAVIGNYAYVFRMSVCMGGLKIEAEFQDNRCFYGKATKSNLLIEPEKCSSCLDTPVGISPTTFPQKSRVRQGSYSVAIPYLQAVVGGFFLGEPGRWGGFFVN